MSKSKKNKKSVMPGLKKKRADKLRKEDKLKQFIQEQRENVWYDARGNVHLVKKGGVIVPDKGYMQGLKHPLSKLENDERRVNRIVRKLDNQIKHEKSIQYHGAIAGQRTGKLARCGGSDWLVTSAPELIEPVKGEFPLIKRLVETMLPDEASRLALHAWLKTQLNAITTGVHSKCPMLILAGDADDGKSFFMLISTILRGGRATNPIAAWSGSGPAWNDHILGAECLNIDDSVAAKDYASREVLGTNFKESCYADEVTIDKRNVSSFNTDPRPVWGVMMAVNANGRAIRVVPAIDEEGMRDKVVILRTHKADIYLREQGDTANKKRLDAYKAELPAFAYWLQKEFCVPAELPVGCSLGRSGAVVYRDQEAMQMLHDESPARQLEYLLLEYIDYLVDLIKTHGNPKAVSESGNGGIKPMTTSKIRKLIAEKDQYFKDDRFPHNAHMMGIYMKQIADREGSCVEAAGKDRNGVALWQLIPSVCEDADGAAD